MLASHLSILVVNAPSEKQHVHNNNNSNNNNEYNDFDEDNFDNAYMNNPSPSDDIDYYSQVDHETIILSKQLLQDLRLFVQFRLELIAL
jgi:hypothetical protein